MTHFNTKTVALCSTARFVEPSVIETAKTWLIEQGFHVVLAKNLTQKHHQFGGTDQERTVAFQELIDSEKVNAIWCVRGGYGTVRMLDGLNWTVFKQHPKQLIGFSDFTILLNHVLQFDVSSIHSPMPIQFEKLDEACKSRLADVLKGKLDSIDWKSHEQSAQTSVSGTLIGGNLSMLYSFMGSESYPKTEQSIFFIEDLDEYSYHIDRMMYGLERSGSLNQINAILVGDFIAIHDHAIPFGETAEEILIKFANRLNIPIYFNFPAGHSDVNNPIVLGEKIRISPNSNYSYTLNYVEKD